MTPSLGSSTRITIHGLQSVLEGITTPNHAIFVFTGSCLLPQPTHIKCEAMRAEWEGFLRRLPVREQMPLVSEDAATYYLTKSLTPYTATAAESLEKEVNEGSEDLVV